MTALMGALDRAVPDTLAAELSDDGDTVELMGRTYRLRVEPDDMSPLDDGDWFGTLEWFGRTNDYGYHQRPSSMDGSAEKLYWGPSNDGAWWQPPKDVPRGESLDKLREAFRELLTYGYSSVGLEECVGADAYGAPVVARCAWLGGVEPFPDSSYVAELVRDLYAELA